MDKTILIIDDDEVLCKTLAKGLRSAGFNVLTANSAKNGGQVLSKIIVDAIVLDRMMTDEDGLTFLKNLRHSGNQTPVIMLTAMTGSENTIEGLSGGANDYLTKPFQLRELVLRINNITQNHRPSNINKLPDGLQFLEGEFFIKRNTETPRILALSGEEKKLLQKLTSPVGNTVPSSPMVVKRLRGKLALSLPNIDIITVWGQGYKMIYTPKVPKN